MLYRETVQRDTYIIVIIIIFYSNIGIMLFIYNFIFQNT